MGKIFCVEFQMSAKLWPFVPSLNWPNLALWKSSPVTGTWCNSALCFRDFECQCQVQVVIHIKLQMTNRVGGTHTSFPLISLFMKVWFCKYTRQNLSIIFIFDRCHCSLAAVMPVKYEFVLDNQPYFPYILRNNDINGVHWLSNPHLSSRTNRTQTWAQIRSTTQANTHALGPLHSLRNSIPH